MLSRANLRPCSTSLPLHLHVHDTFPLFYLFPLLCEFPLRMKRHHVFLRPELDWVRRKP